MWYQLNDKTNKQRDLDIREQEYQIGIMCCHPCMRAQNPTPRAELWKTWNLTPHRHQTRPSQKKNLIQKPKG